MRIHGRCSNCKAGISSYLLMILILILFVACNESTLDSSEHHNSFDPIDDLVDEPFEIEEETSFFPEDIDEAVQLVSWEAGTCDNSYDPYRIVDRISDIYVEKNITYLTFGFGANCCPEFDPKLYFKNGELHVDPYSDELYGGCDCNCCFSIQVGIKGLIDKEYITYFDKKIVVLSEDPYEVIEETSILFEGEVINRTNKYGMHEGLWISYNADSSKIIHQLFPETQEEMAQDAIWKKEYLGNGVLVAYYRGDSAERWFESGELKYKRYTYNKGDTTYNEKLDHFENGRLKQREFTRNYAIIIKDDLDNSSRKYETIYDEEYHENGQLKSEYSADTNRSWHPNGQLSQLFYSNGRIRYDSIGRLESKAIYWKEKGPIWYGDLDYSLRAEYYSNGIISEVHLDRDEPSDNGVAVSVDYEWYWNINSILIKSPKFWNEPLPWERFKSINKNE